MCRRCSCCSYTRNTLSSSIVPSASIVPWPFFLFLTISRTNDEKFLSKPKKVFKKFDPSPTTRRSKKKKKKERNESLSFLETIERAANFLAAHFAPPRANKEEQSRQKMQLCTTQSSEHGALTVCSYVRGLITSLGRTEPPSDAQVAQVTRITINVRYRYASIDGIHPRVADRTHTGRTQPLWWSVGGSVGRSVVRFLHSAPLRFVVYRRRKWGDGR